MYEILAKYYDALVADDQATKQYIDFIIPYIKDKKSGIDFGCGSGEITIALANLGYNMSGNDISSYMLDCLKAKCSNIATYCGNMVDISLPQKYDFALCICDSFNYLVNDNDVIKFFHNVYNQLNDNGIFILDAHHINRLKEFSEQWIEEGIVLDSNYQWTIYAQNDYLNQHFAFYTPNGLICESHLQKVYNPSFIQDKMQQAGFKVNYCCDFGTEENNESEKYFFIGVK